MRIGRKLQYSDSDQFDIYCHVNLGYLRQLEFPYDLSLIFSLSSQ